MPTTKQTNKKPGVIFVRRRRWWDRRSHDHDGRSETQGASSTLRTLLPGFRCAQPRLRRKKKGKRNADRRCSTISIPSRAWRAPCSALASRRSTTALAVATERHRSARATRLPGTRSARPSRWFERRSASQRMTRNRQPVSMRHSRALPAPCCPSSARLHPLPGHDAGRACLAQAAREPR